MWFRLQTQVYSFQKSHSEFTLINNAAAALKRTRTLLTQKGSGNRTQFMPESGSLVPKCQRWIHWRRFYLPVFSDFSWWHKHPSCQRLKTWSISETDPIRTYWVQWLICFHVQTPVYILLQYSHDTIQRDENHINICSCWSHACLKQTSRFWSSLSSVFTLSPGHHFTWSTVHPFSSLPVHPAATENPLMSWV